MNGIDSFLNGECSSLSESDALWSKNWRMVGVVAVVRAKCLKMTFVSRLRHCRGEKVGVYIIWICCGYNGVILFGIACFGYEVLLSHIGQSPMN